MLVQCVYFSSLPSSLATRTIGRIRWIVVPFEGAVCFFRESAIDRTDRNRISLFGIPVGIVTIARGACLSTAEVDICVVYPKFSASSLIVKASEAIGLCYQECCCEHC